MCQPILKKDFVKSKVKWKIKDLKWKKVLILRADRFGDICVSRPFIFCLYDRWANVDIWIKKDYLWLIDLLNSYFGISIWKKFFNLSNWDIYFSYDWEVGKHFEKLVRFVFSFDFFRLLRLFWHYDIVIDLVGRRRFQIVMLIVKVLKKIIWKNFKTGVLFRNITNIWHDVVLYRGDDKNLAEQYLMILDDSIERFLKKIEIWKNRFLFKSVVIHIWYGWEQSRNWWLDNWTYLIKYLISKWLEIFVVYTDMESEWDKLKQIFEKKVKFIKNPKFDEFFSLLKKVDFFIGVDSGPFHLADLLWKRGIVLFSRENEKVRWSFTKKILIVKKFRWVCLRRDCKDNYCIRLIKPDDIIKVLENKIFRKWENINL